MKNLKTFEQYTINEEIDWKKYLSKLRWLGLAAFITFVSCSDSEKSIQFRGTGVVTSTMSSSLYANIKTPEKITVNTSIGEIEIKPYNFSSSSRVPFEVKRGDTLYLNIGQTDQDYVVKIEKGQQTVSTDIWKSPKKLQGEESNW